MAAATVLEAVGEIRVGSSPTIPTKLVDLGLRNGSRTGN